MAGDQVVQIPSTTSNTGPKIDQSELTVGANIVERQRIVTADPADPLGLAGVKNTAPGVSAYGEVTRSFLTDGSNTASIHPASFLRVTDEPRQIFYDPFDGTVVDVTNRWTSATPTAGAVAAAQASGNLTLGTGTTANGATELTSQPIFTLPIPGWMGFSSAIKLESPVVANTYRFWGTGTAPATPTATAPLTDAVGFELFTDGKLYAVVYAAGVRTVVQDLSAATGNSHQPADALFHRYIVYIRTDLIYWYIDGVGPVQLAATGAFTSPGTQTLPVKLLAIAGATAPASSGVITLAGTAVWDTAKNATQIADGTFPWRKATVTAAGEQITATNEARALYRGRVATFRTPGRAGTVGQKIFALHNNTGTTVAVHINQIAIDLLQTAVIAYTVIPPIIRAYRFTALPTNGTALTKSPKDSALASNANVTAWGDASADGTGSATTLTIPTLGTILTQEFAPRLITAAGYEMFDRAEFFDGGYDLVLRTLEGVVIMLDYAVATANPTTNFWIATCDWTER